MNSTNQTPNLWRSNSAEPNLIMNGNSLDQWNCTQQSAWDAKQRQGIHPEEFPNGLICPKDGGRLYDTGQKFLPTMSSPAKLRVKCMNTDCNFRGERLERVNRISD
jgi:hypothetical protein